MDYQDLKILYEDFHIIVVVKPQNVPSQADETKDVDMITLVKQYVKAGLVEKGYPDTDEVFVGLIHRLDRPTGGVMVFAKNSKSAAKLSESMRQGEIDKTYLAVVKGVTEKTGKLTHHLKKMDNNNVKIVPQLTEGAKYAELSYKLLELWENYSLISVNLVTGRPHQIRVQMASIGHSVVGDFRYGTGSACTNLALWAAELAFNHPTTGKRMIFKVYPPEDEEPWVNFNLETFFSLTLPSSNSDY